MIRRLLTLWVFGMIALPAISKPINVLIVDGFSNHDWKHTTQLLQTILEANGEMQVTVSTFPGIGKPELAQWSPEFKNYDVVIQNCNDIKGHERWPGYVEKGLEDFVKSGGGLYVFHSANNSFPQWNEYNRMIGLGWRAKDFGYAITLDDAGAITRVPPGEGDRTSHGKRVDALLTRLGDHPIHAGFPRQWVAADIEIYRYARGPAENLTVLSFAKDEKTGLNFPIEWTVDYGKGRVYNSTLGHVWHDQKGPLGMQCAGHQTLIPRIVQWVAGKEIDATLPPDFPTAEAESLRPIPEK
ncbi:ThuA domain-containing protein [Pontiellaceae bacterium B12227]|nr:ThuA domain-containing protein [Pontiellaceae bacterium B12227]